MATFKEYVEQTQFVDFIINEVDSPISAQASAGHKPWSATKDEIMQIWQNLRPDTPIYMNPVPDDELSPDKGHSSYGEDGVRITGSWNFISSVMARLKELLQYENPQNKLRLVFRGVDPSRLSDPSKQSFAFYANLEKRSLGKPKAPKLPKIEI